MSADTKDHFLGTPMRDPEHIEVKHKHLPEDIRKKCNLKQMKTPDNCIHIKTQKGMMCIKQTAILAYEYLKTALNRTDTSKCLEWSNYGVNTSAQPNSASTLMISASNDGRKMILTISVTQ